MGVQLICNQCIVTYNKLQSINPMFIRASWNNSLDNISLYSVNIQGVNQMGLSYPWVEYIEMISIQSGKKIESGKPNGP